MKCVLLEGSEIWSLVASTWKWKSKQGDNTVCLSNTEQSGVEATPWDGACCDLQLHQLTSSLPLWRLHQITPHDINARGTFLPLPNSISAPFPESWVWKVAKYDHLLQALGSDWKSKQGDNTVSLKYGAKWRNAKRRNYLENNWNLNRLKFNLQEVSRTIKKYQVMWFSCLWGVA